MPKWITVDDETSSTLRSRLPEQEIAELFESTALEHVLNRGETMVAVLPCRGLGQTALAVFRWNQIPVLPLQPAVRINTRAGGILGLSDEPVFEEEDSQQKKSWWRRFWDE